MIIFSHNITPRLQYIADFIGTEITGKPFELTNDKEVFRSYDGPKINYSREKIADDRLQMADGGLLSETGIKPQSTDCFDVNGYKAFFKTEGDFPFDIFAASFYLLSRYEEYLPHEKDMYGRYAHENSLAFRNRFLYLPLVNIWLEDFKRVLKEKYSTPDSYRDKIQHSTFRFIPTYDIDIAYSYLHKGFWRNTAGMLRSMINGQWSMANDRRKVLMKMQPDPFDTYAWMDQLHEQYNLKPYYFFLVVSRNGVYDKNISPEKEAMQKLIQHHYFRYPVGVHPSWRSGDEPGLLKKEIQTLEKITGGKIQSSRQHYIRFTLPETFRQLIEAGIKFDFSMGYGSINGFRASVASPFYWYDLEKEKQTELQLFPYCFMEANSFYEQKYSAKQALEEMKHYYNVVKSVNGLMITIWHNHFFGTEKNFSGWKEIYEQFIKEIN